MILLDKKKEGFDSYKYDEFQMISDSDNLTDNEKKKIDTYDKDKNILYGKYLKESLKHDGSYLSDKEINENYIENFIKFNNNKKQQINNEYSNNQKELFKEKYEPDINTYNESDYVDKIYLRKKYLEKESKDLKLEVIDILPGYISESKGKVLNNIINQKDNNKSDNIEIDDKNICCDFSGLNINYQTILFGNALKEVDTFEHKSDDKPADDDLNMYAYNYPYYKYMENGNKLYDPLYLYYNKTNDIGSINL